MGRYKAAEPTGKVYALLFPNGKRYIGQSRRFEDRMNEHKRLEFPTASFLNRKRHCVVLCKAIQKYKWRNVVVEILQKDLDPDTLDFVEESFIEAYDTTNRSKGYNVQLGGQNNPWDVPEIAAKARATMASETNRAKLRAFWDRPEYRQRMTQVNYETSEQQYESKLAILADARSRRTAETFQKISNTFAEKRTASLEGLSPKEAARKLRKAEKDKARHSRNRIERPPSRSKMDAKNTAAKAGRLAKRAAFEQSCSPIAE